MPLECKHGGEWIADPDYPPHQKRPCALMNDTLKALLGGCPTCNEIRVFDHACEKCSGKDDGTSIAPTTITARLSDAFAHEPKPELFAAIAARSRSIAEESLIRAVRFGKLDEAAALAMAEKYLPEDSPDAT